MGDQPQTPGAPRTVFSPDGLWWWDGGEWRPALSHDGLWRWDGRTWVPARAAARPRGGTAALIAVLAFAGVLFVVAMLTVLILYTMGGQISNVFSNVAAALGSSPSP